MATLLTSVWQVITRKKTTDVPTDGSNHKKVLSVVDLTSLGLATTLGTGVYVILGQESRDHAGPSVVLSFLIASVASFLGGLCYAELGSRFPRAGSSYVYVYATMGELLAFLVGWTMMLELAIGGALAGKAWFQYIDALFNHATSRALEEKIGVIGILGLDRTLDIPAFLVALVAATAVSISVKAVCLFNNFLTIVGFLVIAGIVFVGLFNMDGENWTGGPGFFPNGLSGVLCASSTCCFSFIGYDIMATSAGEAQRHGRTLATAILCAFLVGLFACFTMSISTTLLIPFSLFADRAPLIRLFDLRGIVGMKYFVIVGAFAGLLSALVAALFALGRLVKGLAADGLLFASLARVSAKTGTPWKATMASGFLISLISLFFSVQTLVDLLGIGTILSTMIMALVILRLRYGLHERLLLEHKALSRETTGLSREEDSEISDCYYEINQTTATVDPKRRPLPPSLSFSDARETTELLSATSRPRLETILEENGGATIDRRNPRTPGRNPFMERVPSPPGMAYTDYGSQTPRQMSVEYVNESFISSLMEFQEQPLPTTRTSRVTVVVFGLMVILMAVVALITTYRPELFLHAHCWPEVTTCLSIAAVLVLFVVLLLQPKHSPRVRNKVPCIPALPLGTVWLHVQLLASLPAIAWIRLAVWSFMGLVIYVLHGARHSRERIIDDDDHEVALSDIGDSGHLTLVNSHQQDDSISEDG